MNVPADMDGTLEIFIFSAQHDNLHRGRAIRVYRHQCRYGEATAIARAWKENNPDTNPCDYRFSMGYASVHP